jgi:iron complex outermembrane receptor protein
VQFKIYQNNIADYIMLQPDTTYNPILQARGVVTTIRGTFPSFQYNQTNALLRGGDLALTWIPFYELQSVFSWQIKAALLRGYDVTNRTYLPLLPADRLENTFKFDFQKVKNFYKNYITLSAIAVNRQKYVPTYTTSDGITHNHDFAAAPSGYILWNFGASSTVFIKQKPLQMTFGITNILNTSYRDYLDRLRYFADATGRNITMNIKYSF